MAREVSTRRIVIALVLGLIGGLVAMALFAYGAVNFANDELDDFLPQMCEADLEDCNRLAAELFGHPPPRLPQVSRVGDYVLRSGEESGTLMLLTYESLEPGDSVLMFSAKPRGPGGPLTQPPPGWDGRPVEAQDNGNLRRIDWWDDRFHYAVSVRFAQAPRGSPAEQALRQLVVSARETAPR